MKHGKCPGSNAIKVAVGLAAAALLLILWWWLANPEPEPPFGDSSPSLNEGRPGVAAPGPQGRPSETTATPTAMVTRDVNPGTLLGRVLDLNGDPVQGARIVAGRGLNLSSLAPEQWRGESDEEGWYQLQDLPTGWFGLVASAGSDVGLATAVLTSERPWDRQDLILTAGRGTAGAVVGISGAPVESALVTPMVRDGGELGEGLRAALAVQTGADGAFHWDALPPGQWTFSAIAKGYAPAVGDAVEAGRDDIVLVLGEGGAIDGRAVLAADGTPAVNITVLALDPERKAGAIRAVTGSTGAFSFQNLRPETIVLEIEHPELALAGGSVRVEVEEGGKSDVTLELTHGGIVAGTVRDEGTGDGVPGMTIQAEGPVTEFRSTGQHKEAISDAEGNYEFRGLSAMNYSIILTASGDFAPVEGVRRVAVSLGAPTTGVDFQVTGGLTIGGVVVDPQGDPVPDAQVLGYVSFTDPENPGGAQRRAQTDAEGRFALAGFRRDDSVLLSASTPDAESGRLGPFGLTPPELDLYSRVLQLPDSREPKVLTREELGNIEIVLHPKNGGILSGVTIDERGRPMPLEVRARGENAKTFRGLSDAAGAFAMLVDTPGAYEIQLGRRDAALGYGLQGYPAGSVDLAAGESRGNLRLVYKAPGAFSIRGHVRDSHGDPVLQASLSVEINGSHGSAYSADDGSYEILDLPAGTGTVEANHPEFSKATRDGVASGSRSVDFVLDANPRISGIVIRAAGRAPVESFEVSVEHRLLQANARPETKPFQWFGNPEGRFSLEAGTFLRVEKYAGSALRVRARGYLPAEYSFPTPGPGEDIEGIIIELDAGEYSILGKVLDPAGRPIAGAAVYPVGQIVSRPAGNPGASTDDNGEFRLDALWDTVRAVVTVHPDYAPGAAEVQLVPGQPQSVTIVLEMGGGIEGVVRVDGQPIQGALVWTAGGGEPSTTGVDGRYHFGGLRGGETNVRAQISLPVGSEDFAPAVQVPAVVIPGEVSQVDIDF